MFRLQWGVRREYVYSADELDFLSGLFLDERAEIVGGAGGEIGFGKENSAAFIAFQPKGLFALLNFKNIAVLSR